MTRRLKCSSFVPIAWPPSSATSQAVRAAPFSVHRHNLKDQPERAGFARAQHFANRSEYRQPIDGFSEFERALTPEGACRNNRLSRSRSSNSDSGTGCFWPVVSRVTQTRGAHV